MQHVMFDIDGTLVRSYEFDEACLVDAVKEVTGLSLDTNWETYPHMTDKGILMTFIERQAPHYTLEALEEQVKPVFIRRIEAHLRQHPVQESAGAKDFVRWLADSGDYLISLATGGWRETALMKLDSAGFDTRDLVLCSADDHHSRTHIMQLAKAKAGDTQELPLTYFGDGEWDVKACRELGVNLVIVGERAEHHQTIPDFSNIPGVLAFMRNSGSHLD